MTKDEIIKMAKQSGGRFSRNPDKYDVMEITYCGLEAFSKMVAEKEREECAKIVENRILHDENKDIKKGYLFAQQSIAQDIRTRGQE